MANLNMPRGLQAVRHRSGGYYSGAAKVYYVPAAYATAIYIGDPVIGVTNSGDTNGVHTVAVATAAGGSYVLGAMIGVCNGPNGEVPVTRDLPTYHPASTAGYILVADDPDLLFEIQEDGVGGAMGVNAIGRNVDLIAGTGSTVTGQSGWMADSSTLQTTNTLQLRIEDSVRRLDNDPSLTLAKWLVSINLHAKRNLTGI